MDSFTLTSCCGVNPFHLPINKKRRNSFCFTSISRPVLSFVVLASSKDDSQQQQLNSWDEMELKFGRMLGEDPKLTLAKIKGRKANPDVSYLEIEKAFNKKNFQMDEVVEEFKEKPPNSLNLARPIPKKGVKFEGDDNAMSFESQKNKARLSSPGHVVDDRTSSLPKVGPPNSLNLVRPVPKNGVKFEEDDNAHMLFESQKNKARLSSPGHVVDSHMEGSSIPNVILRKPSSAFPEDDIEVKKSTRFQIKPNLSLKMSKGGTKENFSDITLLKKPEPTRLVIDPYPDNVISGDYIGSSSGQSNEGSTESLEASSDSFPKVSKMEDEPTVGLQPLEQSYFEIDGKENYIPQPEVELRGKPSRLDQSAKITSKHAISEEGMDEHDEEKTIIAQLEVGLQGKPSRLDNYAKDTSKPVVEEAACLSDDHTEMEDFITEAPLQDCEEADWSKAEYLCNTGGRDEVELISCSIRGFVASFGSLIGFLPYRNLGAKWKFLAFESWLRRKGLNPSMYRQNLGIVGRYESRDKYLHADPNPAPEKIEGKLSPDMKLEDLLEIYDQEKIKFLSSFVGLRLKVNVVLADKNSRKLMFSGKPKEKEEMIVKKRSLMEKLNVGDVVKCCIKKITYFGIFVEVEGVPALIHQSEVSWDASLDPSSFFKIGQIVEAKVHQLDFTLDRITLSLKEITPDPLIEALESVVGDRGDLEGIAAAAQADMEWDDVRSLIKELEDIEGVQSVSKGRFFLSPGLAPTFQVYMASMFQNQYKLLARSGNKVQEVIVQASLDKEEMKAAILACTNRVA